MLTNTYITKFLIVSCVSFAFLNKLVDVALIFDFMLLIHRRVSRVCPNKFIRHLRRRTFLIALTSIYKFWAILSLVFISSNKNGLSFNCIRSYQTSWFGGLLSDLSLASCVIGSCYSLLLNQLFYLTVSHSIKIRIC